MSEKTSSQTLAEVLAKTDEQILSNWASLGSLIKNFENVSWQKASQMARELLRDENAMDYIEQVRSDVASKRKGKDQPKASKPAQSEKQTAKKPKQKKSQKAKVIPLNTKRDRFSMNFKRLLDIAPGLLDRLESGEEVYGKSKRTGYMDFNLELIHKNKRGYYVAISHYFTQNGDMVPDPDMQILVDTKNQRVEALAFQNQLYYREVYDDIFNPKLVNERERKSQNSFLEQWLINLKDQGHSVKWIEDDDSPNPVSTQTKKPHIDDFPIRLVTVLREQAQKNSLGDLRKLLAKYLSGQEELTPLFHFITAERINEITSSSEAKYPTQEDLTNQAIEEKDDYDLLRKSDDELLGKPPKLEKDSVESPLIKPDISFMDSDALKPARQFVKSMPTLDDVVQSYLKHESGESTVYAHTLYFIAERINDSSMGMQVPYPSMEDLKRDYEKLIETNLKHERIDDSLKTLDESNIHRENYNKLIQWIPDLEKLISDHGKGLKLKSKHEDLPYHFHLKVVEYVGNGSVNLFFFEGDFVGKELETHSAMGVLFDPKNKEVYALSSMLKDGDHQVYKNPETLSGADKTELKEQNEFFGKWMDELIEQGHKINEIIPSESEVIDEFHSEEESELDEPDNAPQPESDVKVSNETLSNPEIKQTAKHWKKLAAYISEKEVLDKDAAKAKALDLKSKGGAEDYLIGKIERTAKLSDNQLLKLNYQKLNRLVPIIDAMEKSSDRRLQNANFRPVILINRIEKIDKYGHQFKLADVGGLLQEWTIKVQKNTSKVQVIKYHNPNESNELDFGNLDEKFGEYLDAKLKQGLTLAPLISELLEKHPIVIEWTEGSKDMFIGIQDLQELRSKLKRFGFTDNPKETYIKNKVWFRGYASWIRIDVSHLKGDYNPNKMELDDWLDDYDSNFDWYQFNKETDVKELQKKADKIPTFEVGKVELTKEHKRAGLTQRHINWINKNQQGMIITPIKRMTNNTRDFFSDLTQKAQKPGKRISRTGRIYYETRSNRSDMTKAGL